MQRGPTNLDGMDLRPVSEAVAGYLVGASPIKLETVRIELRHLIYGDNDPRMR